MQIEPAHGTRLIDGYGRAIEYLRISVTDRCDLRCQYCMAEKMTFLPKKDVLSLEEIALLADGFIARGIKHIRLSGGEPLMRRDFTELAHRIGRHLGQGTLQELTLTTNGTRLEEYAEALADAGMQRINVSLDSLDPGTYARVTRGGDIAKVFAGLHAAKRAGLAIKINMVALRGINDGEYLSMLRWCAQEGHDLSLIETMPLGEVSEDRSAHFLPLSEAMAQIEPHHALSPIPYRSAGPARYYAAAGLPVRLGLITPLSDNFCAGCNRMRLTCEGKMYPCLGRDIAIDFRTALREGGPGAIDAALDQALARKPLAHDFSIGQDRTEPAVSRHMSVTGG